ncbi:GFA family protein [Hyphobacterium marinum]|uniref:GFA family protein n=1 Tax=Hyphobacterium marinum TaxID=3116574 RepID=A0ABU7M1N0_9PROT|nr:GFA family protein [Hyphobacterium sp. Y6023]MEE2567714.1 GFA family protein [Hyphobacterium sp. Y6023]
MSQYSDPAGSGRCGCGAVSFVTEGPPKFVANCHCGDCRKATGAAFSTWVGYRNDQVRWTGERTVFQSSPGVSRGFCAACGSPLTYQGEKWPGETHLLIGAFDQPEAFIPTGHVFADEALPWSKPDD